MERSVGACALSTVVLASAQSSVPRPTDLLKSLALHNTQGHRGTCPAASRLSRVISTAQTSTCSAPAGPVNCQGSYNHHAQQSHAPSQHASRRPCCPCPRAQTGDHVAYEAGVLTADTAGSQGVMGPSDQSGLPYSAAPGGLGGVQAAAGGGHMAPGSSFTPIELRWDGLSVSFTNSKGHTTTVLKGRRGLTVDHCGNVSCVA